MFKLAHQFSKYLKIYSHKLLRLARANSCLSLIELNEYMTHIKYKCNILTCGFLSWLPVLENE